MGAFRHTMNNEDLSPSKRILAPMEIIRSWINDLLPYVRPPPRAPAIAARMALISSIHHFICVFPIF